MSLPFLNDRSPISSVEIAYQTWLDNQPQSNLFNSWLQPQLSGGIPVEVIELSLNLKRGSVQWMPGTGEVRSC